MTRKKARLTLFTGIAIVVLAVSATQAGESKDVAKRTELFGPVASLAMGAAATLASVVAFLYRTREKAAKEAEERARQDLERAHAERNVLTERYEAALREIIPLATQMTELCGVMIDSQIEVHKTVETLGYLKHYIEALQQRDRDHEQSRP